MDELEALAAARPTLEFHVSLSDEAISRFHDEGYVTVARIAPDAELEWIGRLYDLLFAGRTAPVRGGYFDLVRSYEAEGEDLLPQILAPEQAVPALKETAFWKNGRRLAAQLMGVAEASLRGWGHMIRKPARIGESLPWHQDEAYWDPGLTYSALGCWMPLDAATIESGCMSFVPGSHLGDIRPHKHVGDDPNVHGLYCTPTPEELARAVPAPTPAGGAVLHHCRMLHSSGPNVSLNVRRAYANEWQLPPQKASSIPKRDWIDDGRRAWDSRSIKGEPGSSEVPEHSGARRGVGPEKS
jgi:ectoine hydroxylase-related dioxygenase (phytanoyl-CoA dioxygenase family)